MLQTVTDACQFKQEALDYALSKQIEDLGDLARHDEAAARDFFDRTYVTDGMAQLLRQGLQRLAGFNDQAVFELRQAMGGGKPTPCSPLAILRRIPTWPALSRRS